MVVVVRVVVREVVRVVVRLVMRVVMRVTLPGGGGPLGVERGGGRGAGPPGRHLPAVRPPAHHHRLPRHPRPLHLPQIGHTGSPAYLTGLCQ